MDVRDGEQSMHTDAASFCSAVAQIASVAMSSLLRVDLAKRQHELDMELQIAQETQACILPPSEGTAGSASYVSRIIPGSVVSGDIFDIFEINNNKVAICLGDVTGHGIGSALLMTAIHAQIRASFAHSDNPTDVANAVNAYVVQHSPSNRFASLWIGVFHSVTRTLEYVDAGHGHWLLMPEDGTPLCPDHTGSMIVGIVTSASFCAETLQLAPNERLVLYSDGIIEQPNNEGELFGVDRLIASLRGNTSIKEDVQHTVDTLTDFASTSIFADDTSIVSITFR